MKYTSHRFGVTPQATWIDCIGQLQPKPSRRATTHRGAFLCRNGGENRPEAGRKPVRGVSNWPGQAGYPGQPVHRSSEIDGDFEACVFAGRKMAENLYAFRGRLCGFPKEFE
jgi:hypothetical protein